MHLSLTDCGCVDWLLDIALLIVFGRGIAALHVLVFIVYCEFLLFGFGWWVLEVGFYLVIVVIYGWFCLYCVVYGVCRLRLCLFLFEVVVWLCFVGIFAAWVFWCVNSVVVSFLLFDFTVIWI